MESNPSDGALDSKLLAMLPFIEDVSQLFKMDPKLEKLCSLSVSMSFEGLKQKPTLATLKQLKAQKGFAKFIEALLLSEAGQSILREHPAEEVKVSENETVALVECAMNGTVEKFYELLANLPNGFLEQFETDASHSHVLSKIEDVGASQFDVLGLSLLHVASRAGNLPIIKYILATGFPIDHQSKVAAAAKLTPLMESVRSKKIKSIRLLLTYGAKIPKLRCSAGKSAMDYATDEIKDMIRQLVLDLRAGKIPIPPLERYAPKVESIPLMRQLRGQAAAQRSRSPHAGSSSPHAPPYSHVSPLNHPIGPPTTSGVLPNMPPLGMPPGMGYPWNRSPGLLPGVLPPLGAIPPPQMYLPHGPRPYPNPMPTPPRMPMAPQGPLPPVASAAPTHPPRSHQPNHPKPHHGHPQHPPRTGPNAGKGAKSNGPRSTPSQPRAGAQSSPKHPKPTPQSNSPAQMPPKATKNDRLANLLRMAHQGDVPMQPGTKTYKTRDSVDGPQEGSNDRAESRQREAREAKENMTAFPAVNDPPMQHLPPGIPLNGDGMGGDAMAPMPMVPPGGMMPQMNAAFMYGGPGGAMMGPDPRQYPMGAMNNVQEEVRNVNISNVVQKFIFAGSDDMYQALPELEFVEAGEVVHELWNRVERMEEEQHHLKNQVEQLKSKATTPSWIHATSDADECIVCFEDLTECFVMIPCGHLLPCSQCLAARPQYQKTCVKCKASCTAPPLRVYLGKGSD